MIFGALATGLIFISQIVPIKLGIVLLMVMAVTINIISKISQSEDNTKFSFFKEIIVIKNISESLLKNGHFKVVYVNLSDNISVIGFTNGEVTDTGKIFVFVSTTPIASTGITLLVDLKNIQYSDLSTREALIAIVTGGLGSKKK
ncbi:hypothetical protein K0B03_00140 [Patescibacteria group bacterium]|nr:hypothetical protein [Patescibacteria group bacterium]